MLEVQTATELQTNALRRVVRLEAIISILSPLIFLFMPNFSTSPNDPQNIELLLSITFVVLTSLAPYFSTKGVGVTVALSSLAFLCFIFSLFETILHNHLLFFIIAITVVISFFILSDAHRAGKLGSIAKNSHSERPFWSAALLPIVIFVAMLHRTSDEFHRILTISISTITTIQAVTQGLPRFIFPRYIFSMGLTIVGLVLGYTYIDFYLFSAIQFFGAIALFILLNTHHKSPISRERWYDYLLDHPSRNLMVTFLFLSIVGTILLSLPIASAKSQISLVDAGFTAVSAVCVTGLTVLDTPHDFSKVGQFFILLLIQIGGLGIMSVATVGIHAAGKRLSLKRERAMLSLMNATHNDLLHSLQVILRFTFITELIGAIFLTIFFLESGLSFSNALWNGIFTSISAFCNAGFALFSDNLLSFQSNPQILFVVSLLIILGGISPATALLLPKLIKRKKRSEYASIVLITTAILLIIGTATMVIFEWNGVLAHLSSADKISNAWFQSVTFRTAGFNSVSIGAFSNTTLIVTLVLMFIGGSPGGTAGGIKTTTAAVLFLSFWNTIRGFPHVSLKHRMIPQETIGRAVTILFSAGIVLSGGIILLELTQNLPLRDLIFEATSAIATVGLSTGITAQLDEMGKVVIMFLMYAGRIGPITLFMLLSNDIEQSGLDKPEAQINLM